MVNTKKQSNELIGMEEVPSKVVGGGIKEVLLNPRTLIEAVVGTAFVVGLSAAVGVAIHRGWKLDVVTDTLDNNCNGLGIFYSSRSKRGHLLNPNAPLTDDHKLVVAPKPLKK